MLSTEALSLMYTLMRAVMSAPVSSRPRITMSLKLMAFSCSWKSCRAKGTQEKMMRQDRDFLKGVCFPSPCDIREVGLEACMRLVHYAF